MNFNQELTIRTNQINDIITRYLPPEDGPQKTVIEAMHYSVLSGGKRLRPLLMSETYRLFGGTGEIVEPFIAAMEYIQAYSLVHDDLPALDNDEYRRGKKSTHAAFGEAMGVLAGDALLNYAFETAARAFDLECSPRTAKALQILSTKAGIYGMIGGQVVDVESEGQAVSAGTLHFIHTRKCGALIESSMMIGATLAGADADMIAKAELIGSDVGLAFQIQDDILDVTSTAQVLGKPIGSDEKNGKNTYVSLFGLSDAQAEVARLSAHAIEQLHALPAQNEFLEQLIRYLIHRAK